MKFNTLMRGVVLAGLMTIGSQAPIHAQDKHAAKDTAKVQKDAAKDTRKDAKGKKDKDVQGTKSKGKHEGWKKDAKHKANGHNH